MLDAFLCPAAEEVRLPVVVAGRVAVEAFLSRLAAAMLAALDVDDGVEVEVDVAVGVEDDLEPCRGPPLF